MKTVEKRRKKLLSRVKEHSIVLLYSGKAKHKTTDQFFPYIPNRNFYYLTNIEEENITLLLVKDKKESKTFLFIEETTDFMRQWVGEKISKEDASNLSGIPQENIYFQKDFLSFFNRIMSPSKGIGMSTPKQLYLDLFKITESSKPEVYSVFSTLLDIYQELKIKDINQDLTYIRMFKSKEEIKNLEEAIHITDLGLKRVMKSIPSRQTEGQVYADFIHEITLQGSKGESFNTIMASGENATVLHYEDNNSNLEEGGLLLCDLGVLYKNYGSDISRTYPVNKVFTKRQKDIYNAVLDVNKKAIEYVKPGVTWTSLNAYAKDLLTEHAKNLGIIKEDHEISRYYYHSIGHFLGLDVHDVGQYDLPLEEGMVLTIEPGLYIKEEKIGVRIEDNVLVTKTGSKNLSSQIIKEIEEIEEYMK